MKQTLKIGDKVKHDCLRYGFHMIKSKTGICTICGAYFPEHDLDKTKKVKKYRYSRKVIVENIKTYLGLMHLPYEAQKLAEDLLAQNEDNKECCGGHSNGKSTYVDNMAKIYGVKVKHPTPSPLEIEEIEEMKVNKLSYASYNQWVKIMNKINSLISNQKKLYQYIKEKL